MLCRWTLRFADNISPKAMVELVSEFKLLDLGFGKHKPGVKPADLEFK